MNTKIINIALKQLATNDQEKIFEEDKFFLEYFQVFCENKRFDQDIMSGIKEKEILEVCKEIVLIFENKLRMLLRLKINNDIGLILFIGDGKVDGHSIIVDGLTYVFIDLKAIILRSNLNFSLDGFISHEIIHAIHYKANRDFYPKNYITMNEIYLKTLIVEGMATFMSAKIFGVNDELKYWLGFLEAQDVKEWKINCQEMSFSIGMQIEQAILNEKFDKNLCQRLFCIKANRKFTLYRTGYYYGSEIIKNVYDDKNIEAIFKMDYESSINYIKDFFCISI